MLVMLTDRGHILLQKKEDILSVLSNPSLEKRGTYMYSTSCYVIWHFQRTNFDDT